MSVNVRSAACDAAPRRYSRADERNQMARAPTPRSSAPTPRPRTSSSSVLDLAGDAAHSSERIAAPVACWLAASAGVDLEEAMQLAREVAPDDG